MISQQNRSGCDLFMQAGATRESARAKFAQFADEVIVPGAGSWDRAGRIPESVIRRIAEAGYLGALIPRAYGGAGFDWMTFGLLNEEIGRACSSLRSLLTVHSMVSYALGRWGTRAQQERWLPSLAQGSATGAFALSEPNAGSDAAAIEATAQACGAELVIRGTKTWITFGQIADLFLVFARLEGQPVALLVERETPGLEIVPLEGITGTRAAMLAQLRFRDARVGADARMGGTGFGVMMAMDALEVGRLSVAFGCCGIIRACLEASRAFAAGRKQFGAPIADHQLIRRMLADMAVSVQAAHLLSLRAAWSRDRKLAEASSEIAMAKYFASTAAVRCALDACQLHGARGCSDDAPVDRYLRDARVAEIIEGSTQIQQITLGAAAAAPTMAASNFHHAGRS